MSYPQNTPEGGASPDHRYESVYQPIQPSYQSPQQPSYQPPQQPSYQSPQPAYPQQQSYPPPPDQPWAPASPGVGSPGVGGGPFYEPTRQLPAGIAGDRAAPPYGPPMSGLPSGPPFNPARPGLQPPARRRGAPLLAALAVLLLLVGGVMTALFVTKNSQLSDSKHDVASREAQIKDLEGQLDKAKDDLATARQDLTGTQNAQKETQRQKQVISKCLTLLADLGAAAQRNDTAEANRLGKDVDKTCNEAEKYLD